MKRILISAMTQNRVIGYRGRLPWHIPEEYQHFLDSVRGKTMIMGRKSWEVFGGDVDSQINIVVSRTQSFDNDHVVSSLEQAMQMAAEKGLDCFIAGGAQIYEEAIKKRLVDEMWLSEIPLDLDGDVFFPQFDKEQWNLKLEEDRGDYIFRNWVAKS